jgi:hypothetical protein
VVVAAQPERTSAAAAATAAILVIFLSNCVVPFDLPTGPAEHFFLSSVHLNQVDRPDPRIRTVDLFIDKASTKLENSNLGERSHLEGRYSLAPF